MHLLVLNYIILDDDIISLCKPPTQKINSTRETISTTHLKKHSKHAAYTTSHSHSTIRFTFTNDTRARPYAERARLELSSKHTTSLTPHWSPSKYVPYQIIPKYTQGKQIHNEITDEVKILKSMNHPNVIMFRDFYESLDYLFVAMDYIGSKSLMDVIIERKLSDLECSQLIKHILMGLQYIHSSGYIHRDLKPENIIMRDEYDLATPVIVDFGLGIKFDRAFGSRGDCGTVIYMAPEQVKSNYYGQSIDIWAVGIITYLIIAGHHPFYMVKDTSEEYISKLTSPVWFFTEQFSPLAKDFILHLCSIDIERRYDASMALSHPWITRNEQDVIPKTISEQIAESNQVKLFKAFVNCLRFVGSKKCQRVSYEEIKPIKRKNSESDAISNQTMWIRKNSFQSQRKLRSITRNCIIMPDYYKNTELPNMAMHKNRVRLINTKYKLSDALSNMDDKKWSLTEAKTKQLSRNKMYYLNPIKNRSCTYYKHTNGIAKQANRHIVL